MTEAIRLTSLIILISGSVLIALWIIATYLKLRGKDLADKHMKLYKSLKIGDKIKIVKSKKESSARVVLNTRDGYKVKVDGKIIDISYCNFVGLE